MGEGEKKNKTPPMLALCTDELRRILLLYSYFMQHTSAENPKQVQDMLDYLAKYNIKCSRSAIYRDLKNLERMFGFETYHKRNKYYDENEIDVDEYDWCGKSGYYFSDDAWGQWHFNFLPAPVSAEQLQSLDRLRDFAQNSENTELKNDLQNLSDILEILSPNKQY
ncbi:MAG: hypothetical protein II811_04910 [Spirochaetaceae bacterium]|nr:hypothetical protein [Spirochaetaceae bacterium]